SGIINGEPRIQLWMYNPSSPRENLTGVATMEIVRSARFRVRSGVCLVSLMLALPAWGQSSRPRSIQLMHRYPPGQSAPTPFAGSNLLLYYGGPVMSDAQVVAVFWTSAVDAGEQSNASPFYSAITNSGWMDLLSEYSTVGLTAQDGMAGSDQIIGHGSFARSQTITPSVCASTSACTIDDSQVSAELVAQINAGHL